jgi:hypothetical protein
MYYHVARRNLEAAKKAWPNVQKELAAFDVLDKKYDRIEAESHDYDKLEPLAIQLGHQSESVGFRYAPVLEHLATVHLLSVNCLEATINLMARDRLTGAMFDEFDKLTVVGKWLFLPKIFKLKGFDAGAEPLQTFIQMVKWRNLLTHYRQKREPWNGFRLPTFLGSLGLTIEDGERSVRATRRMVQEIHDQFKEEMDHGWDADNWTYFGIAFERSKGN